MFVFHRAGDVENQLEKAGFRQHPGEPGLSFKASGGEAATSLREDAREPNALGCRRTPSRTPDHQVSQPGNS